MKRGCLDLAKAKSSGSLAHYTKHTGLSRQALAKELRKLGIDSGQRFDFREADRKRAAMRHLARADFRKVEKGKDGKAATASFAAAQAEKECYKAKLAKLEYEEKIGRLVDRDSVEREAYRVGRVVRDAMLSIPDRLAALVTAETDQAKNHAILTKEIMAALKGLPL